MTAARTEALLAALACSRRHVLSERTNDVPQVMATVSQQVCYLMPDVTSPGGDLQVITDRREVEHFYQHERDFMEVVSSCLLAELTSDWFTFLEAVSTTRQVATGTLHENEVVVLFPTADDGIIGEILLARRPWVEVYAGAPDPDERSRLDCVTSRQAVGKLHDRFLSSLVTPDPDAADGVFVDNPSVAVRDHTLPAHRVLTSSDPDVIRRRRELVAKAVVGPELVLLNRIVGDWYVFAEWLIRGQAAQNFDTVEIDQPLEMRCASLFPTGAKGRLAGEIGFSVVRQVADH